MNAVKIEQAYKTLQWSCIPLPTTDEETVNLLNQMGWVWLENEQVWDKTIYSPEFHVYNEF